MKRLKLYLDTTVWNYAFADDAPGHRDETLEFFRMARWDRFEIFES
jgi:predicted nucleic acid-binding protein